MCTSIKDNLKLDLIVDADSIYKLRYNKESKEGFYAYNQRSIHVITSHSPKYSTEPYSLNTIGFDDVPMKLLLTNLPLLLDYFRNLVLLVFSTFSPPDTTVSYYNSSNARRAAGLFSFYNPIYSHSMPIKFNYKMINELQLQCVHCGKTLVLDNELSESELIDFFYDGNPPSPCRSCSQ